MPPSGKIPMPPPEEASRLMRLYFRYIHPIFPLLHKTYMISRSLYHESPPSPILMSAIYAAASVYDRHPNGVIKPAMKLHFERAMGYFNEQFGHNSLSVIQATLILSIYSQGSMSTTAWNYSGIAIRKAYDIGLHRDSKRWSSAKNKGLPLMSKIESECRTRTWWGCYIVDRLISATMGRPTMIHDFTFDTPYPNDYGTLRDESLVDRAPLYHLDSADFALDVNSQWKVSQERLYRIYKPIPRVPLASEKLSNTASITMSGDDFDEEYGEPGDKENGDDGNTEIRNSKRAPKASEEPLPSVAAAPGEFCYGIYYLQLLHILGHVLNDVYKSKPQHDYYQVYCTETMPNRSDMLVYLDNALRTWHDSLPSKL
ncbi:hypothetical protein EV182_005710, partial [Spiromyces aspiralis]